MTKLTRSLKQELLFKQSLPLPLETHHSGSDPANSEPWLRLYSGLYF